MKSFSNIGMASLLLPLLSSCGVFDPPIVTACEANLKYYLLAPSTYTRNRFFLGEHPATRGDIEEQYNHIPELKNIFLEKFDKGTMKPVMYTATLNFSTLNKNAEHVTTTVVCPYLSLDGSTSELAIYQVIPRPAEIPAFSQILRDTRNDPPLTEQEKLDYTTPVAPYAGWIRDTFRRLVN